jgi:hypothetical protein
MLLLLLPVPAWPASDQGRRTRVHRRLTRWVDTGANTRGQALASGLLGPVVLRPHRLVDIALIRAE